MVIWAGANEPGPPDVEQFRRRMKAHAKDGCVVCAEHGVDWDTVPIEVKKSPYNDYTTWCFHEG